MSGWLVPVFPLFDHLNRQSKKASQSIPPILKTYQIKNYTRPSRPTRRCWYRLLGSLFNTETKGSGIDKIVSTRLSANLLKVWLTVVVF